MAKLSVLKKIKNGIKTLPLVKQFLESQELLEDLRSDINSLKRSMSSMRGTFSAGYIEEHLRQHPKYADPRKLNRFEHQIYSQHGEDGIIEEIFNRIGLTNQYFVEFGASNGLENNSSSLLLTGWKGLWLEIDSKCAAVIQQKYAAMLNSGSLGLRLAEVTAENIEAIFAESDVPAQFDLLSIDIDGNDYWVWKAIRRYRPRVVVIEYNPLFRERIKWVMKYNPEHRWISGSYYGASLKSLELLGRSKGYNLVGCDYSGTNAFFVSEELVGGNFLEPFTSDRHYESAKLNLEFSSFHRRDFGEFEGI